MPKRFVAGNAMPPNKDQIAGVVLAGGRSSRMGENKAFLRYQGQPLVEYMQDLLRYRTGIEDVYISGDVAGYDTIPDKTLYDGPASAIRHIIERLSGYKGVLFVPVDMPFLSPDILQSLMSHEGGTHYEGWPLPLYLAADEKPGAGASVRQMLSTMNVKTLAISGHDKDMFLNLNTPEEWKEAVNK